MKRSDIASVLRLTVLAVVSLLGDCENDTRTEFLAVEMSCNSLTVTWAPRTEVVPYNLQYRLQSQRGNWTILNTNDTMFNITQLLSNTTYTVRVKVRVRDMQKDKTIARDDLTTLPRTDIRDNVTVVVSNNSLEIENKLTDVNITCWIDGSDTVKNITISGMSREVVDGLSPNTTYSVDCVEVDEEGQYQCMEYNGTVTTLFRESPTVPGQPTNITVNKTCNSLTLSWLPPGEDGGSNVTDYNVTVMGGTEDGPLLESVPTGGNTTVSITSLKPNTMYTVHIRARNSAGLGPPVVVSVTTEELRVREVNTTSVSATEVTFRLQGSSGNFNCTVLRESTNSSVFRSTVSAGTDVPIDTLTPNTTYSIRCTGIEDQCVEVNEMFKTATIKVPSQPTNIAVNMTCNSLTLSWRPPREDGGFNVTDYNVTVVDGTEDGPLLESVPTGGNTTVSITALKPNTTYTVYIRARNSAGLGPTAVVSVTTEELKVSKVDYKSKLAGEIKFRLQETSGNFTCTVLKESTNTYVFNTTVSAGTDVTIDRLTPNTAYSIRCTGIEDQCVEVHGMFTTATIKVPSEPTNITVKKTCSSLTISWLPPEEDGGSNVTDYNVTVVGGTDGPMLESVPTGGNTTVSITALKPNTMYTVHIRARNSAGPGQPAVVRVTTEELKVREVNTTSVSATEVTFRLLESSGNFTCTVLKESTDTYVSTFTVSAGTDVTINTRTPNTAYSIRCIGIEDQCVEVHEMFTTATIKGLGAPKLTENMTQTTCTTITLHWVPPDNNGDEIQDYNITYYTGGELVSSVAVSGDNTSTTLPNLKPNTMYTIKVRARNSAGTGDADTVDVTTMGRSRGDDSLNIRSISESSLQFSHTLPQPVYYTCERSGSTEQFNITGQGYNLTGLQPDTKYTIECVAYLNGVDYCLEVNTSARTAPGEVDNLTVVGLGRVDGDQIHQSISWRRPPHHTSQLNYTVKYGPSSVVDRPTHPSVNTTTSNNTTVILTLSIPTTVTPVVYNVWVAAVSNVGKGEYRMINITYRDPSPPENITVINKTCNSISVQWSPPSDTGGLAITGYMVDVPKNSFTTNTTMTRTDITNLSPNTKYRVKVETITVFKSESTLTTIKTHSLDELDIHLRPFSSTGLNLTITPPHNKDGVNYTCTLSPGKKKLSGNFTLTDLSPNTTYRARCLVYENGEELCYKGMDNGRTFPSVPEEEPSKVTVTQTESNQFTVRWGPPRGYEYNQDIRGYNVKYWRATGSEDDATTNNVTTTTYTATGLDTNTVYTFRVAAYTEEGVGVYSEPVNISTIPTVEDITPSQVSTTTAVIQWKGVPDIYSIWLMVTEDDDFEYGRRDFNTSNVTGKTNFTIRGLDPFRSYTIEMYLQLGEHGNGSKENVSFRTLGSAPTTSPRLLTAQTNKREATLQWRIPIVSGRNGIITSYEIHWKSANTQTSPITHNVSQPNFTHPEQISRTIQGLAPYTNYTWRVAAVNVNGTGPFSAWDNFTTEEDVPEVVQDLKFTVKPPSTITVEWKPPSTPNGVITSYKVCSWILDGETCSEHSNTTETEDTITDLNPGVPYRVSVTAYTSAGPGPENTLNDIIFTKELPPEQTVTNITIKWMNATTVNISWIPLGIHQARGFPSYRVTILRDGTLLKNRTTTHSSVVIGGLNNNRLYTVTVQLITGGGEGRKSEPVTFGSPTVTPAANITWAIAFIMIVIVLILICLIIVIVVLLCKFKQQKKIADDLDEVLSMKEVVEEVDDSIIALQNMQRKEPIPKHLFSDHVRNMHRDKDKDFISEFASLTKEPPVRKEAAESNRMQNRYINIYPYDYSRVVLTEPNEVDYINAAYIDGYKKPKRYIATQGPIQNTIEDFWEMVWEQKSPMIIMLTRLVEGTKVKCELYWNEEINQPYEPGRGLTVTLTKHTIMTEYEVRHFKLEKASDTSDPLLVKQFLYTVWPDHGVPQYSSSMVKFILQQIKPEMDKTTAPIVVHCSAGAGRTGTLIAIERTLAQLEEDDNINIFEIVESMRSKRTQMVQNTGQYMYVHDAINDYVTCGDTVIVAHELGQKLTELSRMNQRTRKTGFGEQFKMLGDLSPEICDQDIEFSKRPDIEQKNRYTHFYPYCDNFIQTEDDENYVNATYIGGYYGQSGFIAAQAPLKNTIEDTWHVIREQSCLVVVVLCDMVEENQSTCEKFWPDEVGVPMEIGYMKISLMNTNQNEQAEKHSINISIEEGDVVQKIELYHYKSWNKHGRPDVSSLLKLMGDVQKSQQGHTGPVMVMCDDGMSRTGVFITVMSEIDRVKVEGEMDIFHTVKAARTARPYMVSTVADYECCHEILQQYLESFDTYANFQ